MKRTKHEGGMTRKRHSSDPFNGRKILAQAHPNKLYENYNSISDMVLEARMVNGQVHFYETHTRPKNSDWVVRLKPELVKSLFPLQKRKKERPFNKEGNREFYAVLRRNSVKYKDQFDKIINE